VDDDCDGARDEQDTDCRKTGKESAEVSVVFDEAGKQVVFSVKNNGEKPLEGPKIVMELVDNFTGDCPVSTGCVFEKELGSISANGSAEVVFEERELNTRLASGRYSVVATLQSSSGAEIAKKTVPLGVEKKAPELPIIPILGACLILIVLVVLFLKRERVRGYLDGIIRGKDEEDEWGDYR
jgi:hypothetical protein